MDYLQRLPDLSSSAGQMLVFTLSWLVQWLCVFAGEKKDASSGNSLSLS